MSIILQVKAKHFPVLQPYKLGSSAVQYSDDCNCALAKAAKEQFNTDDVSEGVYILNININNINPSAFRHKEYGFEDFSEDQQKADEHDYDETIIREIELIQAF